MICKWGTCSPLILPTLIFAETKCNSLFLVQFQVQTSPLLLTSIHNRMVLCQFGAKAWFISACLIQPMQKTCNLFLSTLLHENVYRWAYTSDGCKSKLPRRSWIEGYVVASVYFLDRNKGCSNFVPPAREYAMFLQFLVQPQHYIKNVYPCIQWH